jgi:hypothetical protein
MGIRWSDQPRVILGGPLGPSNTHGRDRRFSLAEFLVRWAEIEGIDGLRRRSGCYASSLAPEGIDMLSFTGEYSVKNNELMACRLRCLVPNNVRIRWRERGPCCIQPCLCIMKEKKTVASRDEVSQLSLCCRGAEESGVLFGLYKCPLALSTFLQQQRAHCFSRHHLSKSTCSASSIVLHPTTLLLRHQPQSVGEY